MDVAHVVYPLIYQWAFALLLPLTIANIPVVNKDVQVCAIYLLGCPWSRGMDGLHLSPLVIKLILGEVSCQRLHSSWVALLGCEDIAICLLPYSIP